MKNYCKKLMIMFVMLLAFIGVGAIQNGTIASAASVGQQLLSPGSGWQRYDDRDLMISYSDSWSAYGYNESYNIYKGTAHNNGARVGSTIKFKFYGTKLRILTFKIPDICGANVKIDGADYGNISNYLNPSSGSQVFFEKTGLTKAIHEVLITVVDRSVFKTLNGSNNFSFDAVDIDDNGYLTDSTEAVSLNKLSTNLVEGTSEQLVATTTPAAAQVDWSCSDSTVASVDSTGKVTANKEGICTIIATIKDGSKISATCTVSVTKTTTEPTEPTNEPSDGTLCIELLNGSVKSYDVTSAEITSFMKWYKDRDKDNNESPFYQFKKGNSKDYVIHDKIVWFEVK